VTSAKPIETSALAQIDAALAQISPRFVDSARLPHSADLLRRAQLREREIAAERLARWHSRLRWVVLAIFGLAAAALVQGMDPAWAAWLLQPFIERSPTPADAPALAVALLALSVAAVWVSQQFAEE
jgi:hypothetical protein